MKMRLGNCSRHGRQFQCIFLHHSTNQEVHREQGAQAPQHKVGQAAGAGAGAADHDIGRLQAVKHQQWARRQPPIVLRQALLLAIRSTSSQEGPICSHLPPSLYISAQHCVGYVQDGQSNPNLQRPCVPYACWINACPGTEFTHKALASCPAYHLPDLMHHERLPSHTDLHICLLGRGCCTLRGRGRSSNMPRLAARELQGCSLSPTLQDCALAIYASRHLHYRRRSSCLKTPACSSCLKMPACSSCLEAPAL
eukprot:1159040-Pelagomonas_calceolata.AAC.3